MEQTVKEANFYGSGTYVAVDIYQDKDGNPLPITPGNNLLSHAHYNVNYGRMRSGMNEDRK